MSSGIYAITNIQTQKKYIGSSKNIEYRIYEHFSRLKNNSHRNSHLQNSYNKYGKKMFKWDILEECLPIELLNREKKWLNSFPWDSLYNLTKDPKGGGADVLAKEIVVLDLEGKEIRRYSSCRDFARSLGRKDIASNRVNTSTVFNRKYRLVTPEFLLNNRDIINSWKPYTNESKHRKIVNSRPKYKLNNQEYNTQVDLASALSLTRQRVSQLITKIKNGGENPYKIEII